MRTSQRRELILAVLLAMAGGALALWVSSRIWVVTEIARPSPLPPVIEEASGRDTVPWATAMAVVALAGGIALLATRRIGRTIVGAILALAGALTIAGGVVGVTVDGKSYEQVEIQPAWPLLCALGGLLVLASGVLAVSRGRRWAAMGAKYESPTAQVPDTVEGTGLWDAQDRGIDPTDR